MAIGRYPFLEFSVTAFCCFIAGVDGGGDNYRISM